MDRKRRRREKAQRRGVKFLAVFGCIIGVCVLAVIALLIAASSWLLDLPAYDNLESYTKSGITTIYANDRETVLAKLYLENRIEIEEKDVSPYVLEGTVNTEDERFYSHSGVDMTGIVRAVLANFLGMREGASTITQQLIRNTILLDEMQDATLKRKVREAYLAIKVEEMYSKEQILMMYLNVINYGDGCYGIEAASQDYFGKSAKKLSLAEAAMLIGIPNSPTANNPRYYYDNAMSRKATVLDRMLRNGSITQKQHDKALKKQPELAKKRVRSDDISDTAPYFVDYVKWALSNSGRFSESEISKGGLTIYTTLNPIMQEYAYDACVHGVEWEDDDMDASLTAVDPDNGNIIAMVGGLDHDKYEFNLATQMSRQAGSSFKTFTLLAALKAGVDPYNTYIDASSPAQLKKWTVNNSEGQGYGSMNLADATTGSVNTVFARTAYCIGADKVVDMAKDCLRPLNSISLGTFGVNTLEMADAYATIANGGTHYDPVCITEILDRNGETVFKSDPEGERALSPALARTATDILETVVESGTGTAAGLYTGQPVAGKTGTSEHGRDLWFCGITPQLSAAVWVGYRTERETYSYGGSVAAPIWQEFMQNALEGSEIENFPTTDDELKYTYNWEFPTNVWPKDGIIGDGEDTDEDY